MKYAIEFVIWKNEDGTLDYDCPSILSNLHYLKDTYDFSCDYWEWFNDVGNTPELKKVTEIGEDNLYLVFAYGDVSMNGGVDYWGEYDVEIIFEPEYTSIVKMK